MQQVFYGKARARRMRSNASCPSGYLIHQKIEEYFWTDFLNCFFVYSRLLTKSFLLFNIIPYISYDTVLAPQKTFLLRRYDYELGTLPQDKWKENNLSTI
jgi:hypothetical protein